MSRVAVIGAGYVGLTTAACLAELGNDVMVVDTNGEKIALPNVVTPVGNVPGVGYATKRVSYAGDLFFDEAHQFIARNRARPFFLYLALTTPHANNERSRALGDGNEVPDHHSYDDQPWNDSQKNHAAMNGSRQ